MAQPGTHQWPMYGWSLSHTGDGAEAARERIIATVIVLKLVRVFQVEGDGTNSPLISNVFWFLRPLA